MKSVNTWNLTHNKLHQLFKNNSELISIKVRGNAWEPITRWLKFDSRIFRETTSQARITLSDIESLAEIYNYRSIRWKAKKLTPLKTRLFPQSLKNIFRKLPIIKQLAYELEIVFYKFSENFSDHLISIVIPARNEAGNKKLLINALNKFKRIPNKLEIIFVEGNSNDNTYLMLKELKENYADFFKITLLKQTSKGKKNAVVEGFNISSGETLAIIDSDFTVDINDSVAAIMESTKNENILINCARTTFPMEKDAMRWANYIGNRLFAIFLSILINKPISDSLCGTKVFSRKFFKLMKKNGSWDSKSDPFGDFTIIFEAAKNNIKILNYPVRYYARKSGAPNISRWIDGLKLLKVCWIYMISDL
ncbi:glycosyltransferase family 2 protein [Prochlorococcus marinus]|uniref:Glycosyl transferase n=1 Tax=Prochlorococcus marinus str. GP2 TaxID=59925 RepID=A0A0A1ZAM4_PROMR|nr:glycosyltransferase family 2 protein [Prochlorococcus marinus]KGF85561.1 Glycosyl transferase [Prochlorococcus marinus str. GP2]